MLCCLSGTRRGRDTGPGTKIDELQSKLDSAHEVQSLQSLLHSELPLFTIRFVLRQDLKRAESTIHALQGQLQASSKLNETREETLLKQHQGPAVTPAAAIGSPSSSPGHSLEAQVLRCDRDHFKFAVTRFCFPE